MSPFDIIGHQILELNDDDFVKLRKFVAKESSQRGRDVVFDDALEEQKQNNVYIEQKLYSTRRRLANLCKGVRARTYRELTFNDLEHELVEYDDLLTASAVEITSSSAEVSIQMPAIHIIFDGEAYPASDGYNRAMAAMLCYQLGRELVRTVKNATRIDGVGYPYESYFSVTVEWEQQPCHRDYVPQIVSAIERIGYSVNVHCQYSSEQSCEQKAAIWSWRSL